MSDHTNYSFTTLLSASEARSASPAGAYESCKVAKLQKNRNRGKFPGEQLCCVGSDESCEVWDSGSRETQAIAKVVEERDSEFRARLGEAEHDVASAAAFFGDGSAGDFALGDAGPDVVFGGVGVESDFRPLEHAQEFALSGEQAFEDAVEGGVAGSSLEDALEPGAQFGGSLRIGRRLVVLQLAIEPPDHPSRDLDSVALSVVGGEEVVDEPLGGHPAQRMLADTELPGAVGDDDGPADETLLFDRPPHRRFAGRAHRIGRDLQLGDAERPEMADPLVVGRKSQDVRAGERVDDALREVACAHVGERGGIDHVGGNAAHHTSP